MKSNDLKNKETVFDPLDMNNYRVEKLLTIEKKGFERWMEIAGMPAAILVFVIIYYFVNIPFLNHIDPGILEAEGAKRLKEVGVEKFSRINYAMLAIFAASVVLWITEAIPN